MRGVEVFLETGENSESGNKEVKNELVATENEDDELSTGKEVEEEEDRAEVYVEQHEGTRIEMVADELMKRTELDRRKESERVVEHFEGTRFEMVAEEVFYYPGKGSLNCTLDMHVRIIYKEEVVKLHKLLRSLVPPKPSLSRRASTSSSSNSSSSTPTPPTRYEKRDSSTLTMDGGPKLQKILPALERVVPTLAPGRHKGQAGRVAVIGGCREYTGAPYFSMISALKMGADIAHVFCTSGAATVIKSYSPELIVHPVFHESYDAGELGEKEKSELKEKVLAEVGKWLERFDCIVIGPGLGRDPLLLDCVAEIISKAKSHNIPLVIDGDGLFLITNQPELVIGYPLAILTPNVTEHKRLVAKMMGEKHQEGPTNWREISNDDLPGQLQELAKKMEGVTIVQKGKTDYISDGKSVLSSDYFGSPRRCGGQGDVLSGSTAVFVSWARSYWRGEDTEGKKIVEERVSGNPTMVGALAGSLLCRKAAGNAFVQHKRSTVTSNIIECLGHSMDELFPL